FVADAKLTPASSFDAPRLPPSRANPRSPALHRERVLHAFSSASADHGIHDPRGLAEDVERAFLESDLTSQVGLLKDELATERMREDSAAACYGMDPRSATMRITAPAIDGGLDEESSEALMICLVVAGLAL
ncbi:hypothetical protein ACHAWF_000001, partial [Thalassiosira exigua]